MSEEKSFQERLSAHLKEKFNIKAWNNDEVNNSRVIDWSLYYLAARKGRDAVLNEARDGLQKLRELEGRLGIQFANVQADDTVLNRARQAHLECALEVIEFCEATPS